MMPRQSAQYFYFVASGGILWYAWASWSDALSPYQNEALLIPTMLLYALTLPISLLVQIVCTSLAFLTPLDQINLGSTFANWMVKTWALLVIAGYVQWFMILPRLIRKRRAE
jgi:hypothetical protein